MAAVQRATVVKALARLHMLPAVDRVRLVASLAEHQAGNRAFRRSHPDFAFPPAIDVFDAYGKVNWQRFHDSGIEVATYMGQKISEHVPDVRRVLEWGCGPGRVIRHLHHFLPAGVETHGSDYNARSIRWCQTNLPGRFVPNDLAPPIDYPGGTFDAIYAHSVLTHLSRDMHFAWMKELNRLLTANGIVILTLNGDVFADYLTPVDRARYDAGELVTSAGEMEGKKFYGASHPPAFVRDELLDGWRIVEHDTDHERSTMRQDIWVARPPK